MSQSQQSINPSSSQPHSGGATPPPLNWESLGGDEVMQAMLTDFYARIDQSTIRHLFPPDLQETIAKQFAFQSDTWGGPLRYRPWRGEPRMRMRHMPFRITREDAAVWISCMTAAVQASQIPGNLQEAYLARLQMVALAMVNTDT